MTITMIFFPLNKISFSSDIIKSRRTWKRSVGLMTQKLWIQFMLSMMKGDIMNNNTIKHRFSAFISAIVICVVSTVSSHPVDAEGDFYDPKDYTDIGILSERISDELTMVMDNSRSDDLIPVDIWITPCDSEEIEEEVKEKIGYNKSNIIAPYDRNRFDITLNNKFTSEQVDLYIETERKLYTKHQDKASGKFISSCVYIKDLQDAYDSGNIFVSQYAPLIRVSLTKEEITDISKVEMVEEIHYSPDVKMEEETDISIPLIRSNYTRDTIGLTGSGVKIGQIEPYEPNRSNAYFTSSNIFYDTSKSRNYDTSGHANRMAAIMVAKSYGGYRGIVPDAQLYCAYCDGSSDWRSSVEWLLSQGVNVINMSAKLGETSGAYGTQEKWVDHIAINHSVHFVKSSGNDASYVTSPGMAYNVITVGGVDDKGTVSQSDDTIYSNSSYTENNGLTNKPDLIAPAVSITSAAGTGKGTSPAAAHVTAVVAQLCQRVPTLKVMQDSVKSIITAGISHSVLSYDSSSGTNFDKMGAGCVDAQGSYYIANNTRYISSNFSANTSAGTTRNYSFSVSSSDTVIRVSLSWLKYSTLSGTHTSSTPTLGTLADLDLRVYDKNGNLVKSATSVKNNTEIVKFTPNVSLSPYKIEVKQYSSSDRTVYYTVSWY